MQEVAWQHAAVETHALPCCSYRLLDWLLEDMLGLEVARPRWPESFARAVLKPMDRPPSIGVWKTSLGFERCASVCPRAGFGLPRNRQGAGFGLPSCRESFAF